MSRRWRVVLILIVLLGLFVGLLAYLYRGYDWTPDHASFRTNPWGTKALRELCERNNVPTQALQRPLDELADPTGILLCVFDPTLTLTEDEVGALQSWVKDGGHLILAIGDDTFSGDSRLGSYSLYGECGPNRILLAHLGLGTQSLGTPEQVVSLQAPNQGPWTADVTSIVVNSSRRLIRLTSAQQIKEYLRQTTDEDEKVPEITPLVADCIEPVVQDDAGILVMNLQVGQGTIQVISDADIIANGQLGQADNAVLAMNLIYSGGQPQTIYFDEYHHGRWAPPLVGKRLPSAPIFAALWAALGCLGLYLAGSFWRFGQPVPLPSPSRRSVVEHVRAFAGLYQAAHAGAAAVNLTARRFRWRLTQLTALGSPTSPEQLATACARTADVDPSPLAELLIELQAITPDTKLSRTQTLDLIRRIAHFEEAIFDYGPVTNRHTQNV